MDERLRRFEREARVSDGDPLLVVRGLRERLRAGLIPQERMELLAYVNHEPARMALGLAEAKPIYEREDRIAWWRELAKFGRDVVVRCGIALVRPYLLTHIWARWGNQRFAGVAEHAWRAVEALDDWVREPTEERLRALQVAITAALEAPEPAGGVGILPAVTALITSDPLDEAVAGFGEGVMDLHDPFTLTLSRIRHDIVPWALGERDPVKTREVEEGRHFGVDSDISRSVSFSRDGARLLTTCRGTVTIRDAVTGAIVRDFPRVRGEVFSAAFSPDGTRVLAAGQWVPCRLLDVATGETLRSFTHGDGVSDVAFVDDRRVLTAGDDNALRLWDTETGDAIRAFEGHERSVANVVVVAGDRAVTSSYDETVRAWNLATGEALGVWKQPASIDSLAVAPDGEHVLVGRSDGHIVLLAVADGSVVHDFVGPHGQVYGISVAPGGKHFVAVTSANGTKIDLWEIASAAVVRRWDSFHAIAFHVAFAHDGKRFIVGDREGGLRVYTI